MPELRQDPVTLRWVTIATERARRPTSFTRSNWRSVVSSARCPFCEGNEGMTPPETMAFRASGTAPNTPGWTFRVVPNLYAAFGPADAEPIVQRVGPYLSMSGVGAHEVLIDSPDHLRDIADHDVPKVAEVVRGFVDRYRAAAASPCVRYVLLIVNHGREAGASLEHPHAQLFAIPLVPDAVQREIEGVARRIGEAGSCPFCEMVAYETSAGERVIYENDGFLVFAPYASRVPFETWIVPKPHQPRFEASSSAEQLAFADALRELASRLKRRLNDPPYNLYLHTAPTQWTGGAYHWHAEVLPKLSIAAGFELGSDLYIDVVTPEAAAEYLQGEVAPLGEGSMSAAHC